MLKKRKILIVDVPGIFDTLSYNLISWGYDAIGILSQTKEAILRMIEEGEVDLLVVARELTVEGPSRSEDWIKGEKIVVDFDFGRGVLNELRLRNNNLPVILLTTDTLKSDRWIRDDNGKLEWMVIQKCGIDKYDNLRSGIEEFLGASSTSDDRR